MAVQVHHLCMVRCVLESDDHRLPRCCREQRPPETTDRWSISRIIQSDIELDCGREVHALRQRVFRQRFCVWSGCVAPGRGAINETREGGFTVVETDEDRSRALRRKRRVNEEINAVAGRKRHATVARRKWLGGLPVDCHHGCGMAIDAHREQTIARCIEQPQSQPLLRVDADIEGGQSDGGPTYTPKETTTTQASFHHG